MRYSELAELYEKLESTTKRLEKTFLISEFLKKTGSEELEQIALLLQGKLYPPWDEREIGVAGQMMAKAINAATGTGISAVEKEWKKTGDLGKVAAELTKKKKQATLFSRELSVKKVFENIRKLSEIEGSGSVDRKVQLIAELLTSAKPKEALYITRTILQDMRVGVGAGAMRDAIAWAYFPEIAGRKPEEEFEREEKGAYNEILEKVQEAYDLTNDFGVVAKIANEKGLKGLESIELNIGVPLKVMLALKVDSIAEGFETVGKPAQLEYKYDGFRMQVHKAGKKIWIFTRRLEDVTRQFPDVVEAARKHVTADRFIIDCEAVGFSPKTKKYLPFQNISQRIKRKYDIEQLVKELPVELNVFDVMCIDGKSTIRKPFSERSEIVERIIKPARRKVVVAKKLVTDSEKEAKQFFDESLRNGNEGVMIKKLDAPYKPGARVGYMLKYKPVSEYLDLVIVGAEWGEGKRATWLSSFTIACKSGDDFVEIGKVGTGIKEKPKEGLSFGQLTELLKPLITSEKGKEIKVRPEVVVEIGYGEIQKSPTYSSGYALRFPRVIRLRDDKAPDEATTLEQIEKYYAKQKK